MRLALMGTFNYPIEIGDPGGQRFERIEALVDTGASYTVVPASVLQRLGVVPSRTRTFVLGDGRETERELGETIVRIDGTSVTTLVVFGDDQAGPALGVYTLEGLGLAVDPVKRRLVPTEALLMSLPLEEFLERMSRRAPLDLGEAIEDTVRAERDGHTQDQWPRFIACQLTQERCAEHREGR